MNNYDCVNLRAQAHFAAPICRNVFWVPVNTLGGTKYTNEEMQSIALLSPEEKRTKVSTLYEAVQLFLVSKFHEVIDVVYIQEGNMNWEHHKPAYYSVLTNCGCCATDAAWLHYFLKGRYSQTGYFSFVRPNMSGHVYNYIYENGWYYLYDLNPLTDKWIEFALPETGNRLDYFKAKYISGALIKCKSLEDYAHYFKRIQLRAGFDHLFFRYDTDEVPPIAHKKFETHLTYYLPNNLPIYSLLDKETSTIHFQLIKGPLQVPDWHAQVNL